MTPSEKKPEAPTERPDDTYRNLTPEAAKEHEAQLSAENEAGQVPEWAKLAADEVMLYMDCSPRDQLAVAATIARHAPTAKPSEAGLRDALEVIASYDKGSKHGEGICPYGCDTPHIAQAALTQQPARAAEPAAVGTSEALIDAVAKQSSTAKGETLEVLAHYFDSFHGTKGGLPEGVSERARILLGRTRFN